VLPWFRTGDSRRPYHALWLPISALAIASVGQVYQLVHALNIPMFSSQRVSTRFLFLPLAMLIFLAAIRLQEYFASHRASDWVKLVELAIVGVAAQDLWQHFKSWRVTNMGKVFSPQPLDLSLYTVANHPDPPYITVLVIGLAITLVTLLFLVVMSIREQARRSPRS
jgi:chromate transport protein ChrA